MNKNMAFYTLIFIYLLSFLLPYQYLMSNTTYKITSYPGWYIAWHNWVWYLLLLISGIGAICLRQSKKWASAVAMVFLFVSIYVYTIPFHFPFYEYGWNNTILVLRGIVTHLLAIGYYVTTGSGIAIAVILFKKSTKKQRKEKS